MIYENKTRMTPKQMKDSITEGARIFTKRFYEICEAESRLLPSTASRMYMAFDSPSVLTRKTERKVKNKMRKQSQSRNRK